MSAIAAIRTAYDALHAQVDALIDDHSPGAIWRRAERAAHRNAPKVRAWKARAINLNPEPIHNAIALSGMVPMMIDERWHLAVALPQPNPVGGMFDLIDDVVLINPASNKAHVMGDRGADHVGPGRDVERLQVTTDPKEWARSIALSRLEWFHMLKDRRRALQAEPLWSGDISTALLLTDPKRVRWSQFSARIIDVPADMRRDVQRAVLTEARLPKIEGRA